MTYDTFINKDQESKIKNVLSLTLTHFGPMFHLRINQVVGFYQQNIWKKDLWKCDILSKDPPGNRSASLLKMSLFNRCFSNILLTKTNYLVYPKWNIGPKWVNCCFQHSHQSNLMLRWPTETWMNFRTIY